MIREAQKAEIITDNETNKQRIVLSFSYYKGSRFIKQLYQNAITLSTKFDRSDFFITFTCNLNWKKIKKNLLPDERLTNRSNLIARVFNQKLRALQHDIRKKKVLDEFYYSFIVVVGLLSPPVPLAQ